MHKCFRSCSCNSVVLVVLVVAVVVVVVVYLYLSICKLENEAILRDFLNFFFELGNKNAAILRNFNVKNEEILRDLKVDCRADGLIPMRFAIFPVHLSKVLRLPRKSEARSYEVLLLHLSRKII